MGGTASYQLKSVCIERVHFGAIHCGCWTKASITSRIRFNNFYNHTDRGLFLCDDCDFLYYCTAWLAYTAGCDDFRHILLCWFLQGTNKKQAMHERKAIWPRKEKKQPLKKCKPTWPKLVSRRLDFPPSFYSARTPSRTQCSRGCKSILCQRWSQNGLIVVILIFWFNQN